MFIAAANRDSRSSLGQVTPAAVRESTSNLWSTGSCTLSARRGQQKSARFNNYSQLSQPRHAQISPLYSFVAQSAKHASLPALICMISLYRIHSMQM